MSTLEVGPRIVTPPQTSARDSLGASLLSLILVAQAALSVMLLRNTPFLDEATYIFAGQQLLEGKAKIAEYATYISGYPGFYPVIAGALSLLGGLELARLFSTACMLFTTSCVFFFTHRLYSRTSAYIAAALFAFTGPTLYLSHLATFDALALMFLAMATTLAVSVALAPNKQLATVMSIYIAILLVLAVAAKYAALLWVPFVIALLAAQTIRQQGWRRGCFFSLLAVASLAAMLWFASPLMTHDVLQGIASTTTSRTAVSPKPPDVLLATILQAGALIWVLGLFGLLCIPRRKRLVSWLLLIASFAAPAYHLHSGESVSLYKHMSFSLFFAAPVAGAVIGTVVQRVVRWHGNHRVLKLSSACGCAILIVAMLTQTARLSIGSAQRQYSSWPSTSRLAATIGPFLSGQPVRCLCEDAEVLEYELSATTAAWQYTDPYYFKYQVGKQSLLGDAAYTAAVDAGYFAVIELSYADQMASVAATAIDSGHTHYRLVAKIPKTNVVNGYFQVWVKVGLPTAQPLHLSGNHLVNSRSQPVTRRGISLDGSDFMCVRTPLSAHERPANDRGHTLRHVNTLLFSLIDCKRG